jgi:hypothetical protein
MNLIKKNILYIIIISIIIMFFSIPSFSDVDITGVPYIRQVGDTPDDFAGQDACGATSAVMVAAYWNRLPIHQITVTQACGTHTSNYGWYVSSQYTLYGWTFSTMTLDYSNNPAYGAYGYIHYPNQYANAYYAMSWFRSHGFYSTVNTSPTEANVQSEINSGRPVIVGTKLWPAGHVVVIIGYTSSGYYYVNDPWPNPSINSWCSSPSYCCMGSNIQYTWNQMGPPGWLVTADPISAGYNIVVLNVGGSGVMVHSCPSVNCPRVGTGQENPGATGVLLYDSTYSGVWTNTENSTDGYYTWWKIQYSDGRTGWSAAGGAGLGGANWIATTTPTPVVLSSFSSTSGNKQVTIQWQTSQENSNAGFYIYRSTDNVNYTIVNNAIIASNQHNYTYTDTNVVNGTKYYYKLEDVSLSGAKTMQNLIVWAIPSPADLDGNQVVDGNDLIILSQAMGSKPGMSNWNPKADLNGDGVVDVKDLQILEQFFGDRLSGIAP